MGRRDRGHGGRWGRWLSLLVVVALVAGVAAVYRYDLADRWFPREAAPADPAEVAPPPGLDLPPVAAPAPVAVPATPAGLDKAAVRDALAPYLADPDVGKHVLAAVGGLDGGPTYAFGRGTALPASTTKLLTSIAALATLDPAATYATRVVREGNRVVLVGGGDPLLASAPPGEDDPDYPPRADVTTLAQAAAQALQAEGVRRVRVGYDASLFAGPAVNPHWPADYLPDGVVAPITALWVDEGRPESGTGRVADPALAAAQAFAAALTAAGIKVTGAPAEQPAAAGATEIAEVRSAPLAQLVEHALLISDNEATEVLLRHVALGSGAEGSAEAGVVAVRDALQRLGVPTTGLQQYDGSGLSRENRIAPATLLGVVRQAATGAPALRPVLTGLPVAGFTGSLATRFEEAPVAGLGRVRAKTGTLRNVRSLAGIVTTVDGAPLVFVLMADKVRPVKDLDARDDLDAAAAALAACACAGTVVP